MLERAVDTGTAPSEARVYLAQVAREQLKQDARAVLAREQQMSEEPPTARTVAVMPFRLVGMTEDMTPLQTALTDMIITDLSISPAITSIERIKIDAMIDEMLLAQAGLAEKETGARVGRLLKAEHVVQGVLAQSGEKEVRMDATVLNTARREAAGTFNQSEQIDAIFNLEKQIVFNIFDVLGVTLTETEREKINENRATNLLAFLAYGRGLDALDRANFQQAQTYFRQASRIDPSFQRVQFQQQSLQLIQVSQVTSTSVIINDLKNEVVPSPVTATTQSQSTDLQQNQTGNIQQSQGQSSGVTGAGRTTITIRIPRPGN
jgi:TolB-like protein